jgi:hypothetical protein
MEEIVSTIGIYQIIKDNKITNVPLREYILHLLENYE